jgi:DUF4097 and DUF4098 domain-containing protein YvlB
MFMRMQAVIVLGACAVTGLAHAEKFEQRLPVQPHGMVEISNVAGRIDVQGWDNPEVEVRGDLGEGVEKVDFNTDHGHTVIKVRVPNHSFRSASADLRIKIPRDSELDISGVSADVVVVDVEGESMVKTVSGNIRTDVFGRDAEIKTVSGDVAVRGKGKEGAAGAQLHITSISGNIHVDRAGGDLEATTVSGDISLKMEPSRSIRLRSTSGDIGFEGKLVKGANIDAETVSGDLAVRARPEAGLEYQVNTFSGDIKNCMGVEAERVSKYGPGRRLNGSRGTDGDEARIRLKTMSGDVELCDKS